jgi:hypothetical protein
VSGGLGKLWLQHCGVVIQLWFVPVQQTWVCCLGTT